VHAALRRWIAGRDHHPSVWKLVLAQLAIEHQLIAACLCHLRRGCQLVEKQDALSTCWQKLRRHPLSLIGSNPGKTAQVDRIELDGSDIEKLPVEITRYLGNDLRFADAAGAPDMQRHTLAHQRVERFKECGGFHGTPSE
jgi:hypothetical protein